MANDTNHNIFTGRLGKDAETRFMPNGKAVCNFSMAVGKSWKDGNDWKEKTVWIDCAMFGKGAEHYGPKLLKGSQWLIEAEYTVDEWEKDGQKHRRSKFLVGRIQAIGGKASGEPPCEDAKPEPTGKGAPDYGGDFDDDIPFARKHPMEGG